MRRLRTGQHPVEAPGAQVCRTVQAHLAQAVFFGTDHQPPFAVLAPDFRIAEMLNAVRRGQHRPVLDEA